jgi:O-antigen ligase
LIYFLVGRIAVGPWRLRTFIGLLLLLNLKLAQFSIRSFGHALSHGANEMVLIVHGSGAGSTGFFANSADLGVAMCVVWPIATTLLFARIKTRWRLALAVCSLVMLGSILVCGSRGAVVGAVCAGLAALVRSPKKGAGVVMAVLLAVGIYFFLPKASGSRFKSAEDYRQDATANQRIQLWTEGLHMFRDHPVLGVGVANFPPMRLKGYMIPDDTDATEYVPHSVYIQALSELGLAGVLPLIAMVFLLFRLNSRTRKQLLASDPGNQRSFQYCLAIGLDLAFVGYLSSGAFVAVLYYPHLWVLLGLSVGLHMAASSGDNSAKVELQAERKPADLELVTAWDER